jgi:hypothetical protein
MPRRPRLAGLVLFAVLLAAACVHRAAEPQDDVALVDGTITIQCYDGHELLVQGQDIYLVPESRMAREFFEAHDDDFDVEKALILELPGTRSAVIDRLGTFSFSKVAAGHYYVYWQLPPEEKKGVRRHISIDNKVIQVDISRTSTKIVFENLQK